MQPFSLSGRIWRGWYGRLHGPPLSIRPDVAVSKGLGVRGMWDRRRRSPGADPSPHRVYNHGEFEGKESGPGIKLEEREREKWWWMKDGEPRSSAFDTCFELGK